MATVGLVKRTTNTPSNHMSHRHTEQHAHSTDKFCVPSFKALGGVGNVPRWAVDSHREIRPDKRGGGSRCDRVLVFYRSPCIDCQGCNMTIRLLQFTVLVMLCDQTNQQTKQQRKSCINNHVKKLPFTP